MQVAYTTNLGQAIIGDSRDLLASLPDNSIDLVITSPPFALEGRKKAYGNLEGSEYIDWLLEFGRLVYAKLSESGSFVLDLGGAYNRGEPTYSLYQYRTLIRLCDEVGFKLAQPFYWHNTSALPAPIEWVNKRKLRAKNSVNTVWWLSKTSHPKADITRVLTPYSDRMKKMLQKPEEFVPHEGVERPSGHVMGLKSWTTDHGGAIPPNLLQMPNSESNSQYIRYCKALGIKPHPARFPETLPIFFIKYLTDPGDLVVDIFAGSNTTGHAAEGLQRRWIACELLPEYAAASALRFCGAADSGDIYQAIVGGETVNISQ